MGHVKDGQLISVDEVILEELPRYAPPYPEKINGGRKQDLAKKAGNSGSRSSYVSSSNY